MKRPWLLLILCAVALIGCGCLAAGWIGAVTLLRTVRGASVPDPSGPREPTPAVSLERTPPGQAESETAEAIRNVHLPERDLVDLAQRLGGMPAALAKTVPDASPSYRVGDALTFWVHDEETTSFFTMTAELTQITPHAYWWVQEGWDVPAEDLDASARAFEERTYPTNRRVFGSEPNPGIDGDSHIFILLGDIPGVGGYFSSPDEYPKQIDPYSNQHEMFYINLSSSMPGNEYFDSVLAHEFAHMILWSLDGSEETWIHEGLAELAVQRNGYDTSSMGMAFLKAPETQLTAWPEDTAAHYASSYLFMAYLLDRYGEGIIGRLGTEQADGIAGVEAVLAEVDASQPSFGSLFADWAIATYLGDAYMKAAAREVEPAAVHTTFPATEEATVHQFASDYVVLEGEGEVSVEFTGSLQVPLVGNRPHSGEMQWWSKRGNEGDTTLTRGFDLTGLSKATLEVWMWYHLETNYDYAYVEVSADGGETWTLLSNGDTTTFDPVGSSYGPGLTGISGGGETPDWVLERFDLAPFVGQRVLIRFEVVTDATIHYPGLCLDELSIPELRYLDDVEDGEGGWQPQGWVRVGANVPQSFVVQVITSGAKLEVQRMELDEDLAGSLRIPDMGGRVERAIVVVSATTPGTTEWASYRYRVTSP
jgi:hypothetical protein